MLERGAMPLEEEVGQIVRLGDSRIERVYAYTLPFGYFKHVNS